MSYLNTKNKYGLIIKNLLFSSSIKNNTQVIFLLCDGLKDAKEAFVNWKLYKILGAVYLNEIKKLGFNQRTFKKSKRSIFRFIKSRHKNKTFCFWV